MKERLLKAFDAMEAERLTLIKQLDGLPTEVLSRKPSPDEWSVVEVIAHLVKAETGTLNYLRKKLEVGGHRKASALAGLRKAFLNFMISLPIKFKAPKVAQLDPGVQMSYAEAVLQWDNVRAALRKEYAKIDPKLIGNDLFKHPFAGKLNLEQSTSFMHHHMSRHIGQIGRTLKALGH
jgi:hypothetical protein